MSGETLEITFYHSAVCPRCHYTAHALRAALRKRGDVEVTKVEGKIERFLESLAADPADGG